MRRLTLRTTLICATTVAATVTATVATVSAALASETLTYSAPSAIAAPSDPQRVSDVSTADVNGDGRTDLLVSSSDGDSGTTDSGMLSVYLTQSSGGLAHLGDFPAGRRAFGVATGDLDGDGVLDAVTTTYDGLNVLRGHGDGTFGDPVHHGGGYLKEPVIADFDGDGRPDIAAADYYYGNFLGAVDLLHNNGDGTFASSRVDLGQYTFPGRLTAGDLNGDNVVDLVATNGVFYVLIGNGDGTFAAPMRHEWRYTTSQGTADFQADIADVTIGDFNGDGHADVAAASTNDTGAGLWFFPGAADGSLDFTGAASRYVADSSETITSADVDRDGQLDVVLGAGNGPYTPAVVNVRDGGDQWPTLGYKGPGGYVFDTYPRSRVAALDVNGDGYSDLVTVDQLNRLVLVRTQNAPPPPPTNLAPVAQDSARTVPAGEASGLTLSASDPDGDALSYSITTAPSHGTLTGTAPALTYTPDSGYSGPDSVGWRVSDGNGGSDTAQISITVAADGSSSVSQPVSAGQTVSTGTQPTTGQPVQAAVTTPVAGTVTITENDAVADPAGYGVLGSQYVIEAPTASVQDPLHLTFTIAASSLPSGTDASSITLFRDGVAIAACADSSGQATPDPCVADRAESNGTITITVLSSHASSWTAAVALRSTALTAAPAVLTVRKGAVKVTLASLSARLTSGGAGLSGQTLRFTSTKGAFLCQAVTGPNGTGACTTSALGAVAVIAGRGYRVTFAGSTFFRPSAAQAGVVKVGR